MTEPPRRKASSRPVLRYHGGKFRLAPWVISHFPEHRVYVEPFAGGAAVLMRKQRSDFEVYNDLDGDVVNVFRVLRDPISALELERRLRLTPWARAEFQDAYEATEEPIERARRMIVRCFMGHGTTSVRKHRTGFRAGSHPHRRGGGFGDWTSYHDAIPTFTARLQGVVIDQRDYRQIVDQYDKPDALFYVDPPYPLSTRTSMRSANEAGSRAYAHELTDDDHRHLASRLRSVCGAVVLSGYPCRLYDDELYAGWQRIERSARADGGVSRVEVLWIKPGGVTMSAPQESHIQGEFFNG